MTDTATASFNITNVNDAPVLDLDANDSTIGAGASLKTFTIGGPAVQVTDSDVSITDSDNTTMAGATISLERGGGRSSGHRRGAAGRHQRAKPDCDVDHADRHGFACRLRSGDRGDHLLDLERQHDAAQYLQ